MSGAIDSTFFPNKTTNLRTFSMLFAQTGTASIPSSKKAEAEVDPYMIALWWIVPLALFALWVAFKVRSNHAKARANQRLNQSEPSKSKELKRMAPRHIDEDSPSTENRSSATAASTAVTNVNDSTATALSPDLGSRANYQKTSGQSKKKKEKSKGHQPTQPKPPKESPPTAAPTSDPIAAATMAGSQPPNENQPPLEPKPSSAIFEPLRNASLSRRKSSPEQTRDDREDRVDSISKENDAYNQIFGGKFERIIPKQSLRTVANRWPAEATQPPKKPVPASVRTPSSSSDGIPANSNLNTGKPAPNPLDSTSSSVSDSAAAPSATPAPAKGLKGFVSKVKSLPNTENDS